MQLRLIWGVSSNSNDINLFLMIFPRMSLYCKLQWATKVVETLLGNDAFRYLSTYSILFAFSVNSLIPPVPKFNVV